MSRYAEFARFLVVGALNTGATYALYLGLLLFLPYLWSYSLAYAAGILLSLILNARFVFRERVNLRSFLLYPLVYLVQYLVGSACVVLTVRELGLDPIYAPLVAIAVTIPLTFLLSRWVLRRNDAGAAPRQAAI